jgi:hypothetical protein
VSIAVTSSWERVRRQVAQEIEGTPGRMRLWGVVAIVVAVVFGLGAAQSLRLAHDAIVRAGDNTSQLVRIQQIHTSLVRADANATNAFLVGGLAPPEQIAEYDADVARATRLIAEASSAQPADARALAALNEEVVVYTGLVERARANNRLGVPVGAQYLRNASAGLGSDGLPILRALASSNEDRVAEEFDNARQAIWLLLVVGVLAVGTLVGVMWWLARRTHRVLNLPLLGATLAIVLLTGVGLVGLAVSGARVSDVQDTSYASALAAAKARVAAFDAKSNESLTLVARGSGSSYEEAWQAAAAEVEQELPNVSSPGVDLGAAWEAYAGAHATVRSTDDEGDWDRAVSLAVNRTDDTAPNQVFTAFDTASAAALEEDSAATAEELSAAGWWMPALAVLVLVLSAAAAALAWRGMAQRLGEYR